MKDDVVLVTGAAGALGSAVARAFLAAGARVVLTDRSAEAQQRSFADLAGSPSVLLLDGIDVTNAISLEAAVARTVERFERVDALVCVAGAYKGKPILDEDPGTWDFLMDLNARSVFLACRAVAWHMKKQGHGRIVTIGSPAALAAFASGGVYAASKAAVLRLTEALSHELRGDGINVNAVLPGTMDTPANRAAMPDADPSKWVTTAEVAEVVLFLASTRSRGIHGAAIPVLGRG